MFAKLQDDQLRTDEKVRATFARERISRLYFDQRDHDLLRIVGDIVGRTDISGHRRLLAPYLHPHGIKEMAAQRPLRIAYAVAHLLDSLEIGKAADRLSALRSLRDEVLYTSQGPLRLNAARVLIEIMKALIRSRDEEYVRQLSLARDFRAVTSGRPRVVRRQLQKYYLLEMPEDANQVAFDDHVHDANTKGRKSATHLVMDAWIKGIRKLTVIYYNHVSHAAAEELLEAAAIMGLKVRIGIEFFARFHSRYIKLIWVPRGLTDTQGFLSFLSSAPVRAFMDLGREVSRFHGAYVLDLLEAFNRSHRLSLNESFGVNLEPLNKAEFLAFVGDGQASLHHLGRFIHDRLMPLMRARVAEIATQHSAASPQDKERQAALVARMNRLDAYELIEDYLRPARNPGLPDPDRPTTPGEGPELLSLTAPELLDRIDVLHPRQRIVLNLSGLSAADVLELLYDCRGRITHLEILNLKNMVLGREHDRERILDLQRTINTANVIRLKRHISALVKDIACTDESCDTRKEKLIEILYDMPTLQSFYRDKSLKSCIGSDSTGQSGRVHGMGIVLKDSLPRAVQRRMTRPGSSFRRLPVTVTAYDRETLVPREERTSLAGRLAARIHRVPGLRLLGYRRQQDWLLRDYRDAPKGGNIYAMGGVQPEEGNGFCLDGERCARQRTPPIRYLNTRLTIALKILAGFVPAFLTFALTKDWWLLAYFGAFIWFAITGVRNIIQSVLGCGGIHRSSLVRWNSLVSWSRMADSLLYTGLSVPLLEYLVKTVIFERMLGITVASNAFALYAGMSLVNGLYIAGHNFLRGLQRGAIVGNLFRSVLAIPLSLAFNLAAGELLFLAGVPGVALVLQKWAAIIAKLASDCVAGVIEGFADRAQYLRLRHLDYDGKLQQLFDLYARLELLYPLEDVLQLLESTTTFMQTVEFERRDLVNIAIVNSLDLMYFWMYQPRARLVLRQLIRNMTMEERRAFLLSQHVLFRDRQISQLFLDGLVGRNFAKPLAFYLDHWSAYLEDIEHLAGYSPPRADARPAETRP